MLQHMKVVDSNGESAMDEDQWDAASTSQSLFMPVLALILLLDIYIAFAFEKRSR